MQDAAVLEATLLGAELEFTSDATVAVTGAPPPDRRMSGIWCLAPQSHHDQTRDG
ncbi:MAG: hypothetical protein P4M05_14700 [Bradyrhizobium sp.]|nr:hypothetical protein [Bradyrhizobium sp.]